MRLPDWISRVLRRRTRSSAPDAALVALRVEHAAVGVVFIRFTGKAAQQAREDLYRAHVEAARRLEDLERQGL